MKQPYEEIDIEVVRFDSEDVITASGAEPCREDAPVPACPCIEK